MKCQCNKISIKSSSKPCPNVPVNNDYFCVDHFGSSIGTTRLHDWLYTHLLNITDMGLLNATAYLRDGISIVISAIDLTGQTKIISGHLGGELEITPIHISPKRYISDKFLRYKPVYQLSYLARNALSPKNPKRCFSGNHLS